MGASQGMRTGHSHEDIDEIFGRLSKFMVGHGHGSQTPDDFRRLVGQFFKEQCFHSNQLSTDAASNLIKPGTGALASLWCPTFVSFVVCCSMQRKLSRKLVCFGFFNLMSLEFLGLLTAIGFMAFQIVAEECISKPSHTGAPSRHR